MENLGFIVKWKRWLMSDLAAGKFRENEWREFIEAAYSNGCTAIADDMEKRFEHYLETKESEK